MKKITILLFILFTINYSYSQNYKITGKVIDSLSLEPLAYVNISLINSLDTTLIKGTVSKEDGSFSFENIENENITIRFSFVGYNQKTIYFENNKSDLTFNLNLTQNAEMLNEVNITAEKPLYKVEANKKIYIVENDPIVQGLMLNDALQNAPSVNVSFDNLITIRGSQNIGFYIDDKPINMPNQDISIYIQQIPASSIKSIEVMTNPPAKYKSEYVINIVTKNPTEDKILYNIGLTYTTRTSYHGWNTFTYKKDKINFYIQGYSGLFAEISEQKTQNIVLSQNDTVRNFETENNFDVNRFDWNLNTYLTYTHNDNNSFSLSLGGLSNNYKSDNSLILNSIFPISEYEDTKLNSNKLNQNFYGSLSYKHSFKKEGHQIRISLRPGYYITDANENYLKQNIDSLVISEKRAKQNWNGKFVSFAVDYSNPINDYFQISTGFSVKPYDLYYDNKLTDTCQIITTEWKTVDFMSPQYSQENSSSDCYIDLSGFIGKFNYGCGLSYGIESTKYDFISQNYVLTKPYKNLMPTANISYSIKDKHNFSLSYSHDILNPTQEIIPIRDYSYDYEISEGNIDLKPENSDKIELDYSYIINSGGMLNISFYQKNSKNSVADVLYNSFDNNLNKFVNLKTYDNADIQLSGLEINYGLSLNKKIKLKFYSNSNYSTISGNYNNLDYEKSKFYSYNQFVISYYMNDYFNISIFNIYKSSSYSFLTETEPGYFTNISISGNFPKISLRYTLKFLDVFNSNSTISTFKTNEIINITNTKQKSRYIAFGIMYSIGNKKFDNSQAKSLMNL